MGCVGALGMCLTVVLLLLLIALLVVSSGMLSAVPGCLRPCRRDVGDCHGNRGLQQAN